MSRLFLLLAACTLAPGLVSAQSAGLAGKLEGDTYVSPTGEFRISSPVLPELNGTITDTENVVTFNDPFNTHISIACFPLDATQRWEFETQSLQDYLLYFFNQFVLPDFQRRYPGSSIESARFLPELLDGSLITYALLPGGSHFQPPPSGLGAAPANPVTAKRGTLLFVRNHHIYILSTELAERATQRSTYSQTVEKENQLLAERLTTLASRLIFTTPRPRSP